MGWISVSFTVIICFLLGFMAGSVRQFLIQEKILRHTKREAQRDKIEDQGTALKAIRREIANHLITRDIDAYVRFYERVLEELDAISKSGDARIDAEEALIFQKYPLIAAWDPFGTRDYISYDRARSMMSDDELYDLYRDIVIFQTIARYGQEKAWNPDFHSSELKHLREYVEALKDTYFQHRITEATREVENYKSWIAALSRLSDDFEASYNKAMDAIRTEKQNDFLVLETQQFVAALEATQLEIGYSFSFKADGSKGVSLFFHDTESYGSAYRLDACGELKDLDAARNYSITVPFEANIAKALGYK